MRYIPYIPRKLERILLQAKRDFPAIVVTGPRRACKTTLSRKLFRRAQCMLLEDPDIPSRVRSDARGFLEELRPAAIFDEIQTAPELPWPSSKSSSV